MQSQTITKNPSEAKFSISRVYVRYCKTFWNIHDQNFSRLEWNKVTWLFMRKVSFALVHCFQTCLKSHAYYFTCLLIYQNLENEQICYNPTIWKSKLANNPNLKPQKLQNLKKNPFLESIVVSVSLEVVQVLQLSFHELNPTVVRVFATIISCYTQYHLGNFWKLLGNYQKLLDYPEILT